MSLNKSGCVQTHVHVFVADLERTHGRSGFSDTRAISQVKESVGMTTKTGKAAALRERCQQVNCTTGSSWFKAFFVDKVYISGACLFGTLL
jgi:hypothetical protein